MTSWKIFSIGFLGAVFAIAGWIALNQLVNLDQISRAGRLAPGAFTEKYGADYAREVDDYLRKNPQVVVEFLKEMQTRRRAAQTEEVALIITKRRDEIFNDPDTPVSGNPQGDVSIVEFFDYNCPYCRRVASTLAEIEGGDAMLRVVYKEWPILGPNSEYAARAALAAQKQEKYIEFHKALMLAGGIVDQAKVVEVAGEIGLDVARLKNDMAAPEIAAALKRTQELARALRITGTPTFVIGHEMLRGAADAQVIRGLVSQARETK